MIKSLRDILQLYPFLAFIIVSFLNSNGFSLESEHNLFIKEISVQRAGELIESNKDNPEFVILDLRTANEYKSEHIEHSMNIDFFSDNFKNELNKLDKDKTYIIHCRSGGRAFKTLPVMKELGFKKVYNMQGIVQWKEAGFKTVETE